MNNQLREILKSKMSIHNAGPFTPAQRDAALITAIEYADVRVNEYRAAESKAITIESIRLLPALWKGEYKLWLRKRSFVKAKKAAQIRANIENRPIHVLRVTDVSYTIQSTREVRDLKKAGVYKDRKTSIKVYEMADATMYPQKNKS